MQTVPIVVLLNAERVAATDDDNLWDRKVSVECRDKTERWLQLLFLPIFITSSFARSDGPKAFFIDIVFSAKFAKISNSDV